MNLRNVAISAYLRTTLGEDDKEISLFDNTREGCFQQKLYDLLFYHLLNGDLLGSDSTGNINTGFSFDLATDDNPDITSQNDFNNLLNLNIPERKIDAYETETDYVYEVTMNTTNVNNPLPVTGVSIYYTGIDVSSGSPVAETLLVAKSKAPLTTTLYGANGLLLNGHDVKLRFEIRVPK